MKTLEPSLRKVAVSLYCSLNTPRALAVEILLRYGEFDQLATLAIDPKYYLEGSCGAEKYRRDCQATDFLRKSPLLPITGDRREAAVETFWECEKQCHETNALLDLLRYPSASESSAETALRGILLKARKIASRILGPLPEDLDGAFGPGTCFEMKGQAYSTLADKLWITPHVTDEARVIFDHLYWRTHWGRQRIRLGLPLPAQCRGNRFTTVPKDAKKDRGICVEPLGNLWCQLGVGQYLKRRLANVGLKVGRTASPDDPIERLAYRPRPNGQFIHRVLARDGSIGGGWGTIDLSNASDTVALELVRWVLPPDWFNLLYALRSPFTFLDGKWVRLDKFSSMGNGFTFELETLLFAAILAAGLGLEVGRSVLAYGDDILLPEQHGDDAMAILRACGFTPNMRKSFVTGPFRESCGGDFFSGYNVRPVFATKRYESPLEWVALHNRLVSAWPSFKLVHKRCVDAIPSRLRLFGPPELGNRVLYGTPRRVWEENGCKWVATIKQQPLRIPLDRWGEDFTLTLALLGVRSNGISPRGEISGYRISRASVS